MLVPLARPGVPGAPTLINVAATAPTCPTVLHVAARPVPSPGTERRAARRRSGRPPRAPRRATTRTTAAPSPCRRRRRSRRPGSARPPPRRAAARTRSPSPGPHAGHVRVEVEGAVGRGHAGPAELGQTARAAGRGTARTGRRSPARPRTPRGSARRHRRAARAPAGTARRCPASASTAATRSSGRSIQPSRQPVIAQYLENELTTTAPRSRYCAAVDGAGPP